MGLPAKFTSYCFKNTLTTQSSLRLNMFLFDINKRHDIYGNNIGIKVSSFISACKIHKLTKNKLLKIDGNN